MAWTPPKPFETYEMLLRQFRALCVVHASVEAQLLAIQMDQHREMQARAQLDGERAANKLLTDEIDRLLAENDDLHTRLVAAQAEKREPAPCNFA